MFRYIAETRRLFWTDQNLGRLHYYRYNADIHLQELTNRANKDK